MENECDCTGRDDEQAHISTPVEPIRQEGCRLTKWKTGLEKERTSTGEKQSCISNSSNVFYVQLA